MGFEVALFAKSLCYLGNSGFGSWVTRLLSWVVVVGLFGGTVPLGCYQASFTGCRHDDGRLRCKVSGYRYPWTVDKSE